jgi:hypothetical protein
MIPFDFSELPFDPDESRAWRIAKTVIWLLVAIALTVLAVLIEIWWPG